MRKISISLLLVFLSVSAFAGNHDKLVGEWSVNIEKLKASDEFKEATKDPQAAQMMQFMLGMMAKMSFKFTKAEAIAIMPGMDGKNKEDKSNYTVVSDKDKTLEIKTSKNGREEVMVLTFIDDNNVKMGPKKETPDPLKAIFLTKKTAKKEMK